VRQSTIDHLKSHKAEGESGILPELLKCGGSVIVEKLVELLTQCGEINVLLGIGVMLLYLKRVI